MLLNSEAGGWISSLLLSFMNTWGFINICTAIEKQFKSGVSVLKNKQQGILFFVQKYVLQHRFFVFELSCFFQWFIISSTALIFLLLVFNFNFYYRKLNAQVEIVCWKHYMSLCSMKSIQAEFLLEYQALKQPTAQDLKHLFILPQAFMHQAHCQKKWNKIPIFFNANFSCNVYTHCRCYVFCK